MYFNLNDLKDSREKDELLVHVLLVLLNPCEFLGYINIKIPRTGAGDAG